MGKRVQEQQGNNNPSMVTVLGHRPHHLKVMEAVERQKVVVVGDSETGKTSIMYRVSTQTIMDREGSKGALSQDKLGLSYIFHPGAFSQEEGIKKEELSPWQDVYDLQEAFEKETRKKLQRKIYSLEAFVESTLNTCPCLSSDFCLGEAQDLFERKIQVDGEFQNKFHAEQDARKKTIVNYNSDFRQQNKIIQCTLLFTFMFIHLQKKNLLSQEFQDWLKSTVGNKMKCIGNSNKLTIPMDQELKENVAFWQEFQHQKRKKRKSDGKDMYADHP